MPKAEVPELPAAAANADGPLLAKAPNPEGFPKADVDAGAPKADGVEVEADAPKADGVAVAAGAPNADVVAAGAPKADVVAADVPNALPPKADEDAAGCACPEAWLYNC